MVLSSGRVQVPEKRRRMKQNDVTSLRGRLRDRAVVKQDEHATLRLSLALSWNLSL